MKEENGNDSGFFALMGSPNGKRNCPYAYIPITAITLGHKTIESVRVLEDGSLTMYFVSGRLRQADKKASKEISRRISKSGKATPEEPSW